MRRGNSPPTRPQGSWEVSYVVFEGPEAKLGTAVEADDDNPMEHSSTEFAHV